MSEQYCIYCDKQLDEKIGEISHGCINCNVNPLKFKLQKHIRQNSEFLKKNTELQAKLDKAIEALKMATESAIFFCTHADCRRDTWACRCSFCRDNDNSKKLRLACEALKELGVER